ncbi:MAG: phosphate regulon sensor histidine kinase PhoR [Gammaproteobacteria bacterium]
MINPWTRELRRIAGLLLVAVLIGAFAGSVLFAVLPLLGGYLAWHLYNLQRLVRWLHEGKKFRPPEAGGIWDEVFEQIYRLQQRNRKRKRDLRRLLKRFHKITVALPDATVELRPGTEEIEWWNHAASRYLGFEHPRDVGQRISNLLRHPAFLAYLHGEDYEQSIEMPSPVDEAITLRVRAIPYSGNRRLVIARDITRTQALERTRRDFVANASHELRTPLTVVAGYLETLLEAQEPGGEYADQLRSMQRQTERMQRIVDDLMLLSRLESEAPQMDAEPVPVARLIDAIVNQARELSGDQEHLIELDVDQGLCLKGREPELYSAFSNLVFNAVRYTPARGRIGVCWKDIEGAPVFSVEDTGVGIAPYHLPRLTERFYRIDTGRSRASGGTGLGLAIVKHVLLRHDARLQIHSEPGRGSVFLCHFPAQRRVACSEVARGPAGQGDGVAAGRTVIEL